MKLILFAFAATAFSGSSRAKEDVQSPSNPEEPVPKPTSQPEPKPITNSEPQSTPEPAIELSEEEKKNPLGAFQTLDGKILEQVLKLDPLKKEKETAKTAFGVAKKEAEAATNEREKAQEKVHELDVLNATGEAAETKMKELKEELQQKKELEDKAIKEAEAFNKLFIKAKIAHNKVFDNLVAAERELELKAPLLRGRANENAKSAKEKTEIAAHAVEESETELKKAQNLQRKIREFIQTLPAQDLTTQQNENVLNAEMKRLEIAAKRIEDAEKENAKRQDALTLAKAGAKKASDDAKTFASLRYSIPSIHSIHYTRDV